MDENEKFQKFKQLRKMIQVNRKAQSQRKASKNPKKFMEENKEPSIKNLKGVAF